MCAVAAMSSAMSRCRLGVYSVCYMLLARGQVPQGQTATPRCGVVLHSLACEGRAKVNFAPLRGILAPVTPCILTVVH
ncbi:hypothetical protein V8C86DRAFT_2960200, partial [Haematococcus lacustris]